MIGLRGLHGASDGCADASVHCLDPPGLISSAVSVRDKLQVHMQPHGLQNSCA